MFYPVVKPDQRRGFTFDITPEARKACASKTKKGCKRNILNSFKIKTWKAAYKLGYRIWNFGRMSGALK